MQGKIPSRRGIAGWFVAGLTGAILASVVGSRATVTARGVGPDYGPWTDPVNVQSISGTDPEFNTAFNDGCPTLAPDGRTLFMASNRTGTLGGQDIWIATRESPEEPWGAPVNVGEPVNSIYDDFCPSPTRNGHLFFFVSTRPGGCGGSDIYMTRWRNDVQGWTEPENLGCEVNSSGNEASPFLVMSGAGAPMLYFSSNRAGGFSSAAPDTDDDIYVSEWTAGGFTAPELVAGVNTEANDSRPNLSHDGRELFFDSNRPGTFGGPDIYYAVRDSGRDPWSIPENLGPSINTSASETRASLSWDGTTLVFGSTRPGGEGGNDIYMTTRTKLTGRR